MTVKELIEELQMYDEDMEVKFAYNYGDHWRTQVAARIDDVDELTVGYSEYHNMDKVLDEDDNPDNENDVRTAVVIS